MQKPGVQRHGDERAQGERPDAHAERVHSGREESQLHGRETDAVMPRKGGLVQCEQIEGAAQPIGVVQPDEVVAHEAPLEGDPMEGQ